jgi:hypothetical protein
MLQNYLACGTNSSESVDMFGLNAYEWCGNNNMMTSGYNTLNTYAQGYNIPIFFSETGCNTVQPRTFEDQSAIFGSAMNDIWSGAIIYELRKPTTMVSFPTVPRSLLLLSLQTSSQVSPALEPRPP